IAAGLAPRDGEALLGAMTGALAHRGPDAGGVWVSPGIGLGHRRLAIVGIADGQQPMRFEAPDLTIAFNGEIFNFVELRAELEAKGHVFRTGSDTEVLLHLYAEHG